MTKSISGLFLLVASAISLAAQPVITSQPTNQVVLNSSNAAFSVVATGLGMLTYQWRFNGTNLPNNVITTIAGGGTGGDGGAATDASLNYPTDMTLDGTGNLFIADAQNNRIRRVDINGIITTVAGTGSAAYGGDGGAATNASLNFPLAAAADAAGNLWIADNINNRIRRVDTNGIITTVAGNGIAGYSGDGGIATNASLNSPQGISMDTRGNLYIADYANHRIRRVDTNGIITTAAGNGSFGYSGDGILATNTSLNYPSGVAFDSTGNLYVADYGNSRIRKVDLIGIITTVAGNGQPYAGGDGGAATNASLQDAVFVAVDGFGKFYIADVYDNLIRQVNTNGIITTLIGVGSPFGMTVDQFDNLYIAERQNNLIGRFALLGPPTLLLNHVTTNNAGNYDVVINDAHGSITSSVVSLTVNVPVYISTPPASQQISVGSNATFTVTAGGTLPLNYQWLFNGTNIFGATNNVYSIGVVTTNNAGNYSVSITNNYGSVTSGLATLTVLIIPPGIASQPASQTVPYGSNTTFSVLASGSPPFNYQWFFNGAVLGAQTNSTLALSTVATYQAGAYSVFISSLYGSITSRVATLTVGWLPIITSQPANQILLAGSRMFLAANVSGVGPFSFQWRLNGTNLPNNLISTIAGNGTSGFAGDGGIATTGKINGPYGLASDSFGNIFIADTGNHRIRKISTNGVMTTVAGTGIGSYSGDGGAATNARLNSPNGVAIDGFGNLIIADTSNNRIRKVDTNGIITTMAGTGGSGFSGDGGLATNATVYNPYAVSLDGNGNLFIADTLNTRVRKVATNGIIITVAGKSGSTFSGDGGVATNAGLSAYGVAVDAGGNLFIADRGNNRIRRVDSNGIIATIGGTGFSFYSGEGGQATNAGLTAYGVAVDNYGDVYIADRSNARIRRIDPYGIITTIAGTNSAGYGGDGLSATNALLGGPSGIALDSYGRFLIADSVNHRIRRFGHGPSLVFDNLAAANAGDYTLVIGSSFGSVTSSVATLTVLSPPNIVIQPANLSAGMGSNTTFTVTVIGTAPLAYQWQFSGTNLPNQTSQSLNLSNVQFGDGGNYRVIVTNNYGSVTSSVAALTVGNPPALVSQPVSQMILSGTNLLLNAAVTGDGPFSYQWQFNGTNLPPVIITVAGNGTNGFSGDGGAATNARLGGPRGLVIGSNGVIYIADYGNNRVRKVDTNGIITTVAGNGTAGSTGNGGLATNATLRSPQGMALDKNGNLYFAEGNSDIRKVATNGIISRVAGTTATGYSGDGGQATNSALFATTSVVVDPTGNLFVTDFYSYRIRKVGTNGIITTVVGNGNSGSSGDGGLATNATMGQAFWVALDSLGNIVIADYDNYRVRIVDTNGIINTIAGGGADINSNGILATNANLKPYCVGVDPANNIFIVCDSRVRKVDANGVIITIAGGGATRPGDFGPATSASLSLQAIAFDGLGNLFLTDNARIRKVCFSGLPSLFLQSANTNNTGNYTVVITSPFGSVTSSNFTLTVFNRPVFGSSSVGADGSVTLNLSTTPDVSSRVYTATNLTPPVTWLPIFTNLTGGIWQFTDTNTAGRASQFYRVSTP